MRSSFVTMLHDNVNEYAEVRRGTEAGFLEMIKAKRESDG